MAKQRYTGYRHEYWVIRVDVLADSEEEAKQLANAVANQHSAMIEGQQLESEAKLSAAGYPGFVYFIQAEPDEFNLQEWSEDENLYWAGEE